MPINAVPRTRGPAHVRGFGPVPNPERVPYAPVNLFTDDPQAVGGVTTTATITGTVARPGIPGSLIIAAATLRTANTATVCTFTDTIGLTWTTAVTGVRAAAGATAIGWAFDPVGVTSGTITATFDVTGTRQGLSAHAFPNMNTTNPVDSPVTTTANGATGVPTVTSANATVEPNELIFVAGRHNTSAQSTPNGAGGYVERVDFIVGATTQMEHYVETKWATAIETPSTLFTPDDQTVNWDMAMVAFRTMPTVLPRPLVVVNQQAVNTAAVI